MSAAGTAVQHYEGTPGGKRGNGATWQGFQDELKQREHDIATMLPPHISKDRFTAVAVAAVKQNPKLLKATPRSLFAAIGKAAQDGLLPDGREGVISIYNTNVAPKGQREVWEEVAQWNPMIAGLRKRARELDGILIDAQVVHLNDHFVWDQGDEPRIEHKPAALGTPRGEMTGAYAIFKREDGTILHREVMDRDQIEMTRNQSKAKDSLMWTKFQTEGYRKAVARRGFKSLPVSPRLDQIVRRDDEAFDYGERPAVALVSAATPPSPPPAPKAVAHTPQQDVRDVIDMEPREAVLAEPTEAETREIDTQDAAGIPRDGIAEWVADRIVEADGVRSMGDLEELDNQVCRQTDDAEREDQRALWNATYQRNKARLGKKK